MFNYYVFNSDDVKKAKEKGDKILIVADCRYVAFGEESNKEIEKFADEQEIEIYEILFSYNDRVKSFICRNFGDRKIYFEESLI